MALVVSVHIFTRSSILTRVSVTLVNPRLAVAACKSWLASAPVAIDTVHADPAVHTRAVRAVPVIGFTGRSRETQRTSTSEGVDVVFASCPILARIRSALV